MWMNQITCTMERENYWAVIVFKNDNGWGLIVKPSCTVDHK